MLRMSEVTTPANAAFTQALSANEVIMDEHAHLCFLTALTEKTKLDCHEV